MSKKQSIAAKRKWRKVPSEQMSDMGRKMAIAKWSKMTPKEKQMHSRLMLEARREKNKNMQM